MIPSQNSAFTFVDTTSIKYEVFVLRKVDLYLIAIDELEAKLESRNTILNKNLSILLKEIFHNAVSLRKQVKEIWKGSVKIGKEEKGRKYRVLMDKLKAAKKWVDKNGVKFTPYKEGKLVFDPEGNPLAYEMGLSVDDTITNLILHSDLQGKGTNIKNIVEDLVRMGVKVENSTNPNESIYNKVKAMVFASF